VPKTPTLDRLVVLVPVRALEGAKARLGEALDAEERRALVERLLARTIAAAAGARGVAGVAVVSPDAAALDLAASLGATAIRQAGQGLNEGLAVGRDRVIADGADALLVVPADLPGVSAAGLAPIVEAAQAAAAAGPSGVSVVALVTDRAGEGNNALLLVPPDAIPFHFGPGSRAAHAAAARAAGATYVEVAGPLDLDLDTPDDLLAAEARGLGTLTADAP